MPPKRKKSRSNLDDAATPPIDAEIDSSAGAAIASSSSQQEDTSAEVTITPNRSGWSWRSKASPTAQVACESISVAQGATTESSERTRPPNSISKSVRGSRKSIPLVAEATRVHAVSDGNKFKTGLETKVRDGKAAEGEKELVKEAAQLPPDPVIQVEDVKNTAESSRSSWFGWWSRPDGYASDSDKRASKKPKLDIQAEEAASQTPLPGSPVKEAPEIGAQNARHFEGIGTNAVVSKPDEGVDQRNSTRSWFGLWSSTQNEKAVIEPPVKDDVLEPTPDVAIPSGPASTEEAVADPGAIAAGGVKENQIQSKPSGWAFWSSEKPKYPASSTSGTQKQIGRLAVADTPSQDQPEAAQFNERHEELKSKAKPGVALSRPDTVKSKRSKDMSGPSAVVTSPPSHSPAPSISSNPAESMPLSEEVKPTNKGKNLRKIPDSILPSFRDAFPPAPNLGYMERLTQYLAQSLHIPGSQPTLPPQHIFITSSPPRIKKAVAIGVHGYFPGALLQKVLGQPTGTSIRFANHAATAIEAWCRWKQLGKDVEIEKVALEGEGFIADRVSMLWKLLLNWLSHLRSADLILIACHSQGVPVAIMLLAKLIQLGCLSSSVRIGVCAMAGINLGPFPEYKSRLFGGSALELFEFCNSESIVSKSYSDSLDVCLRHGVRITYVGSIDDQLVSLESALHASLGHPYVARAVFIDGRLHAPNFLTHLVVFALKLRNRGVSDHGLLRELSGPLAGSLVSGDGHSRIYDDHDVYALAVEFTLESTDVDPLTIPAETGDQKKPISSKAMPATAALSGSVQRKLLSGAATSPLGIAPTITPYEAPPNSANANPFFLPWAVRGMLEEKIAREDPNLRREVEDLVKEFDEWKPVSKVLKDVRWRLEGIRSMNWYDMTFAS